MGNENSGNRSNHGGERANFQPLFMPTEMWIPMQKLIAKYEIGKAQAYLYCINETLHNEGFMDDEENYLICELIYEYFGTKDVVVRLNDRGNFHHFHGLGALFRQQRSHD